MHPVFSSAKNLSIVTGLWLVVSAVFVYLLQHQVSQLMSLTQAISIFLPWFFVFLFFCISNFYICIRFPIDRVNFYHVLLVQLGSLVCVVGMWCALGYAWLNFLSRFEQLDGFSVIEGQSLGITVSAAVMYSFFVMAHYIFLIAKQQEALERDALQKKLLLSQIELQTIKASTHPHFLYNALNMLANIALTNPSKVNKLCLQIADFLRYSVNYSSKEFVSIHDELSHVQNYLGIERERYGKRLKIEFSIDEKVRPFQVMPLILFPLVENAIKHGVDSLIEGGAIKIKVVLEDDLVRLRVSNHYDPLGVKATSTHLGLSALKKRLKARYAAFAKFDVSRQSGDWFVVEIEIPRKMCEK